MHIQNRDFKLHWSLFLVSVCIICVIGCQINYALFFICYATLSKSCNSTSISWYFQQRLTRFKPLPPIMLEKKKKKKAMWCEFFELMIYLYFAPIWILIISVYVYVFFFFFFLKRISVAMVAFPVDPVHYSWDQQTSFFNKTFIKNGSHGTIHIFKNYFATMFFIFQFSENKRYPNTLFIWTLYLISLGRF